MSLSRPLCACELLLLQMSLHGILPPELKTFGHSHNLTNAATCHRSYLFVDIEDSVTWSIRDLRGAKLSRHKVWSSPSNHHAATGEPVPIFLFPHERKEKSVSIARCGHQGPASVPALSVVIRLNTADRNSKGQEGTVESQRYWLCVIVIHVVVVFQGRSIFYLFQYSHPFPSNCYSSPMLCSRSRTTQSEIGAGLRRSWCCQSRRSPPQLSLIVIVAAVVRSEASSFGCRAVQSVDVGKFATRSRQLDSNRFPMTEAIPKPAVMQRWQ